MSQARRLTLGDTNHTQERDRRLRGIQDGPWPRLRAILRDADRGRPIDPNELAALIEAAGKTPPNRVYRSESTIYARARALAATLAHPEEN
jgi:hypothetical protein